MWASNLSPKICIQTLSSVDLYVSDNGMDFVASCRTLSSPWGPHVVATLSRHIDYQYACF